jgi:hypothetical protein
LDNIRIKGITAKEIINDMTHLSNRCNSSILKNTNEIQYHGKKRIKILANMRCTVETTAISNEEK